MNAIIYDARPGGGHDGLSLCGCLNVYIGQTFVLNIPTRDAMIYVQDAVNCITKTGSCNVAIINKVAKKMHDPERKR
jgi:hypothetical protein